MASEKVWTWLQTKGKVFKMISNPSKGTIEVLDENGETVIRKTNLSRRQVEMVEKNFREFISRKKNGRPKAASKDNFDPMIT